MKTYAKGSNAERKLIHRVFDLGFVATRTAGSGSTSLPAPDLLILGKGIKLAVEAKAWDSDYLHLAKGQMDELISWSRTADFIPVIGWKKNRTEWVFLNPEDFNKSEKNYILSWNKAEKKGKSLEVVLGLQKGLMNEKQ
ncbi:MAG: Holliday junction resolvase Hjc [Candidatus Diapherotrites archaeon]